MYSGDDQFVGIVGSEVEWRRSVFNRVDALDCFVKRAFLYVTRLCEYHPRHSGEEGELWEWKRSKTLGGSTVR